MYSIPIYTRIHFIHISSTECYYAFNYKNCLHATHFYFINFIEGVDPPAIELHCGCASFHKFVVTINPVFSLSKRIKTFLKSSNLCNFCKYGPAIYFWDVHNSSSQKVELKNTVSTRVGYLCFHLTFS